MPSQGIASPRLVGSGVLCAAAALALAAPPAEREWLAGDSHIHSHWSTGYDYRTSPPTPIKGRDALYSTPRNAAMARRFGLRWMVTTDHGGPYHSKVNLEQAHRELTLSRELVPEVLPVLRHGAQHAGHGPPHPDHPPRRRRGVGAARDREPFRRQRGLGPAPRPAPAVGGAQARGARAHAGAGQAADPVREPSLPVCGSDRELRPRRAVGAPREQRPRPGRVPRDGRGARPPGRHPHGREQQRVPRLLLGIPGRRPWAASTR